MNDYELLDFGEGRRLERLGSVVLDRPCPAAETARKADPPLWKNADFRFESDEKRRNSDRGEWMPKIPEPWWISCGSIRFELRGSPFGHVGVFPEQRENWRRIESRLAGTLKDRDRSIRILNLFAYTGGSSIAANLAGTPTSSAGVPAKCPIVEVVHVDSSKSAVDRARVNAKLSGVSGGIRYIVEDARKFVRRELKRGNRYEAVILDPPSYGHGVKGEAWKIADHLPELLADLAAILSDRPAFFLLTAHTPGLEPPRLREMLLEAALPGGFENEAVTMEIASKDGRKLPSGCGVFSTWR